MAELEADLTRKVCLFLSPLKTISFHKDKASPNAVIKTVVWTWESEVFVSARSPHLHCTALVSSRNDVKYSNYYIVIEPESD